MKWVGRTGIVLAVLIIIVVGTIVFVSRHLDNRVADAHERGFENGYACGYMMGYEEGSSQGYADGGKVGCQKGSMVGYDEGRGEGYNSGYATGFMEGIGNGYLLRNPTYEEVQKILAGSEMTSAWEINNIAEAEGIRAAYVRIRVARWYPPHRMASSLDDERPVITYPFTRADWSPYCYWVAFETADKGLIFVQPWSKKEIKLETGKRYSELLGSPAPDYDDTVVEIITIW